MFFANNSRQLYNFLVFNEFSNYAAKVGNILLAVNFLSDLKVQFNSSNSNEYLFLLNPSYKTRIIQKIM